MEGADRRDASPLLHHDLEVGASAIAGQGLFTRRYFSSGDRIPIVTKDTDHHWIEMDDEEFRLLTERAASWDAVYLGHGRHRVSRVPREVNPANYGNHSCAPNTVLVAVGEIDRIALRDIAAGEELTIDYGTLSPVGWAMRCTCGAPACRGIVRGTIP